jgi:hypothetical protein
MIRMMRRCVVFQFHHPRVVFHAKRTMIITAATSNLWWKPPSLPPTQTQQQQQQRRSMTANQNRKNRKARERQFHRIGGSNTNGRMLNPNHRMKLRICHSDSDLIEGTIINTKFNYENIQKIVNQTFDTTRNLQYYHDTEQQWKNFPPALNRSMGRYKRGHLPLSIRIPEQYFDENRVTQARRSFDKYLRVGYDYESDETIRIMKDAIHELIETFQKEHRHDHLPHLNTVHTDPYNTVPTSTSPSTIEQIQQWVLQQANESHHIQSVLLRYVGALDHIVQLIYYKTVRTESTRNHTI